MTKESGDVLVNTNLQRFFGVVVEPHVVIAHASLEILQKSV